MKSLIALAIVTAFAGSAFADVVEFHIAADTGPKPWNTMETSIQAKLGDTIRFINDDSIVHRLHTNGAPCSHGPNIAAATSWDCQVSRPFSAATEGPLYDHYVGEAAEVWIEAK